MLPDGVSIPHTVKGWCEFTHKVDCYTCVRMYCMAIISWKYFQICVETLIFVNCALMAWDPDLHEPVLAGVDHLCTVLFTLEVDLVQMFA